MLPYFLQNLVPKKEKLERTKPLWEVLKALTLIQWGFYFTGFVASSATLTVAHQSHPTPLTFDLNFLRWLAWTCDAIDFFSVSLTVVNLQKQFNRSTHDIVSWISPKLPIAFS